MQRSFRTVLTGFVLAGLALPAAAQDDKGQDRLRGTLSEPPSTVDVTFDGAPALSPEDAAILRDALQFDGLTTTLPAAPKLERKGPKATIQPSRDIAVSRNTAADGTSTVSVKKPLATEWAINVGADLGMAQDQRAFDNPNQALAIPANTARAAWASVGVTDYATIDARVDPGNEQGRFGGTLKHSIPLGDRFSVTVQNSSAVNSTFAATSVNAPAGLPLMAMPQDPAQGPARVWQTQQAVKFNVLSTNTTLGAGVSNATNDRVTRNTLMAEQKLFGNFHVTTAVSDLGQPIPNKSISAGFKLNW